MTEEVGIQTDIDLMSADESVGDLLGGGLKRGFIDITGVIFSEDLDFLTKALTVVSSFLLSSLILYLLMPGCARKIFLKLDFDENKDKCTVTGVASLITALAAGMCVL